ncbi:MAG: HD domain-containing protein [Nitrospinae bacterium]|nr:HD domain-containing protein [Nitrospinota bacterium]
MNHQLLLILFYITLAIFFLAAMLMAVHQWRQARRREELLMGVIIALNELMELKDGYTEGHCARVKRWARDVGGALGLKRGEIDEIAIAAMIHDIGKIGAPDEILRKPSPLTEGEYAVIKTHPALGAKALHSLQWFVPMARIIKHHHERYDGAGYPDGLQGEGIPVGARIVALLDAYDAMTSNRSYRPAMERKKALAFIREGRGTQFDPKITDIFLAILENGGKLSHDPVCGMAVKEDISIVYKGRSYYFCSRTCREEFENKPEKYGR